MLEIFVTVLLIAWILGLLSSYTLGGGIHLCLVLAAVFLAVRFLKRRSSPSPRRVEARVKRDQSYS